MRARREAGFTLLELVVTTGVLTAVMLLAAQLLGEAGRLQANAQIEFAEPTLDLTTRWLRRDIQAASGLGVPTHESISAPLEIWGNPEGIIRYEKAGTNLNRIILGMEGEELGRRTMMRNVVRWEWRSPELGLLEIELVYQHRVFPQASRRGGPPVEFKLMSETHRFAIRGGPRSHW